jgi:hypothetical protein
VIHGVDCEFSEKHGIKALWFLVSVLHARQDWYGIHMAYGPTTDMNISGLGSSGATARRPVRSLFVEAICYPTVKIRNKGLVMYVHVVGLM